MIRPERKRCISPLLQHNKFFHDGGHINVSFQMICFKKTSVLIAAGAPQVDEVYPVSQSFDNAGEIIIGANAKRPGAKAQSVARSLADSEGVKSCTASASVLSTLGSPKIGNGGSSG